MNRPDASLVADAWLKLVSSLPASCVGPTLPAARATPAPPWTTQGFLQHTPVGGASDVHVPRRRSVMQVDAWAVLLDSRAVPWGRASKLIERVWAATYGVEANQERLLEVPAGYAPARLLTVRALGEPVKVPGDDAGFAHFRMDVEFTWVPTTMEE